MRFSFREFAVRLKPPAFIVTHWLVGSRYILHSSQPGRSWLSLSVCVFVFKVGHERSISQLER